MILDRRVVLIAGGLVLLSVVLFILSSRTPVQEPEPVITPEPVVQETKQPASFPLSESTVADLSEQASQEYSFASGLAREWREDSVFVAAITEYKGSIDPKNGKNTYIFASPSLPIFYWTMEIDQARGEDGKNRYERLIRYKEDFVLEPNTTNAPVQYWKISYLDALTRSETLGANLIRSQNPNYDVTMILSATSDRYLSWDIEYKSAGKTVFRKALNAATGEELTPVINQ